MSICFCCSHAQWNISDIYECNFFHGMPFNNNQGFTLHANIIDQNRVIRRDGINHLSVTSHPTMNISKQRSKITPNNADVAHVSSITPSNLLHPRPLINHLSVTLHPTGDSKGSSRHHYHNISAYTGSSTSRPTGI